MVHWSILQSLPQLRGEIPFSRFNSTITQLPCRTLLRLSLFSSSPVFFLCFLLVVLMAQSLYWWLNKRLRWWHKPPKPPTDRDSNPQRPNILADWLNRLTDRGFTIVTVKRPFWPCNQIFRLIVWKIVYLDSIQKLILNEVFTKWHWFCIQLKMCRNFATSLDNDPSS